MNELGGSDCQARQWACSPPPVPAPQWSDTGGCGADGSDAPAHNDVLIAYVEHLGAAFKSMQEEVQAVESRQSVLDRRLTEFGALLQGMQEEQYAAMCMGASGAPASRQHPVPTLQISGTSGTPLDNLGDLVLIGARGDKGNGENGILAVRENDKLHARLQALERDQKTVAVGVHRALQASLVARQDQQWRQQEDEWYRCLEGLIKPAAELEKQWACRFNEQDQRLERIIHMVDSLADNVLRLSGRSSKFVAPELSTPERPVDGDRQGHAIAELRDKVNEMEHHVVCMSSAPMPMSDPRHSTSEGIEAQIERRLAKIDQRMEALSDDNHDMKTSLRSLNSQLPDVKNQVDQLRRQCHDYFPRITQHDVRFEMFKKSFESHKQHMLEAVEHHPLLYVDSADRIPGSPEESLGDFSLDKNHAGFRSSATVLPPTSDSLGRSLDSRLAEATDSTRGLERSGTILPPNASMMSAPAH